MTWPTNLVSVVSTAVNENATQLLNANLCLEAGERRDSPKPKVSDSHKVDDPIDKSSYYFGQSQPVGCREPIYRTMSSIPSIATLVAPVIKPAYRTSDSSQLEYRFLRERATTSRRDSTDRAPFGLWLMYCNFRRWNQDDLWNQQILLSVGNRKLEHREYTPKKTMEKKVGHPKTNLKIKRRWNCYACSLKMQLFLSYFCFYWLV